MVRSHLGIALLPGSICNRLVADDFHIIDLEPTIYWRLSMVWSHDVFISNSTRLWIEFFKKKVKEIPITALK